MKNGVSIISCFYQVAFIESCTELPKCTPKKPPPCLLKEEACFLVIFIKVKMCHVQLIPGSLGFRWWVS